LKPHARDAVLEYTHTEEESAGHLKITKFDVNAAAYTHSKYPNINT